MNDEFSYERTSRGFEIMKFRSDPEPILQQSSAIGDYEDAMDRPGTSFLWIGYGDNRAHFNRERVKEVADAMNRWLETGKLHP